MKIPFIKRLFGRGKEAEDSFFASFSVEEAESLPYKDRVDFYYNWSQKAKGSKENMDVVALLFCAIDLCILERFSDAEEAASRLMDYKKKCPFYVTDCHHTANTVFGLLCLKKDEVKQATVHLISSGELKDFPEPKLIYMPHMILARELLYMNEQLTVIKYLNLCLEWAGEWISGEYSDYDKWIEKINRGEVPSFDGYIPQPR